MTSVNCVICAGRYLEFPPYGYVGGTYETTAGMHSLIATAGTEATDADLVGAVREGDDAAFEALYQRYFPRISAFVCRMLHDTAGCEDVAQEAFMSALRRMRATDSEINFKPWIYQIARNAAIDAHRRRSHAVEVSMDADDGLRASDRTRLVGLDGGPDAALITKERLTHLQGAFDELSDVHTRVLVMRELEGMSYREIGKQLDLTRPAVESALFRARRRLESEYTELSEGRRCEAMRQTMMRMAAGTHKGSEEHRLARHARRCHDCRRRAREMGIEPLTHARHAAPEGGGAAADPMALPPLWRRRRDHHRTVFLGRERRPAGGTRRCPRGRGRAGGCGRRSARKWSTPRGPRDGRGDRHAAEHSTPVKGESQRGTAGHAADGERAGARRASGRRAGPAGGRAGDSGDSLKQAAPATQAPAGGSGGADIPGAAPAGSLPSLPGGTQPPAPILPAASS